jgi:hypothetical protein
MRAWTLPLVAAVLIAAATAPGFALPSLGGPTGIVMMPTAEVAPATDLQLAVSYRAMETQGMYQSAEAIGMYEAPAAGGLVDVKSWSVQALRGAADEAELWAAYRRLHNSADTTIWEFGGKLQVDQPYLPDAQVAIGASIGRWVDAFGWVEAMDMYSASQALTDVDVLKGYVVVTRDLTPGATPSWEWGEKPGLQAIGSVGLFYLKASPDAGEEHTVIRPFVGLELQFDENLIVGLEYRAKDSEVDEKALFSAVLRRQFPEDLTVELGTTNASPVGLGLGDQDIFIRVAYDVPLLAGY